MLWEVKDLQNKYLGTCKASRSTTNDNQIICILFCGRDNQIHQLSILVELYCRIRSSNMISPNENVGNWSLSSLLFQFILNGLTIVCKKWDFKVDRILLTWKAECINPCTSSYEKKEEILAIDKLYYNIGKTATLSCSKKRKSLG